MTDISKATGFSIGSIYHHFENKEAILLQIAKSMGDMRHIQTDIENKAQSPYAPIMRYLLTYAKEWELLGVDLCNEIYKRFDRVFLTSDYILMPPQSYKYLTSFIQLSQEVGTFDKSITAAEATSYIITASRGLIFEWVLMNGSFSLVERARHFLPRILKTFMEQPEP